MAVYKPYKKTSSGKEEIKIPYSSVAGTPTIPTVNNGTLTIQKNGTNVATFGANQSANATANITVPTKVSELTNDSGYTTNKGTVTQVKINGTTKSPNSAGLVDLGTISGGTGENGTQIDIYIEGQDPDFSINELFGGDANNTVGSGIANLWFYSEDDGQAHIGNVTVSSCETIILFAINTSVFALTSNGFVDTGATTYDMASTYHCNSVQIIGGATVMYYGEI